MSKPYRYIIAFISLLVVSSLSSPTKVYASVIHNIHDSNQHNLRFTLSGYDLGGTSAFDIGDIDGNGKSDLVVSALGYSSPGRSDNGALFIIFDSLLDDYSSTGNTIDLNSSNSYNLKIIGSVNGEELGDGGSELADINHNGKDDLVIGTWTNNFYVVTDDILRSHSSTPGSTLDLLSASNYYLKVLGTSVEAITTGDVNGDGLIDIATGSWFGNAGYVFFNDLLNSFSNYGNSVNVSSLSSYSIKIFSSGVGSAFGNSRSVLIRDINNDQKGDLIVCSNREDFQGRTDSGSIFVVGSDKLRSYTGTGNQIDFNNINNLSLRIDGAVAGYLLGFRMNELFPGDVDHNGKVDLILGSYTADFNSRTDSGVMYLLKDSIIESSWESSVSIDLNTTYSVRFDGDTTTSRWGYGDNIISDINNDGNGELIIKGAYADYSPYSDSGKILVIPSTVINAMSVGSIVDLSTFSNYSILYHSISGGLLGLYSTSLFQDLDNDGTKDMIVTESSAGKMQLYVIFNFPHSINLDTLEDTQVSSSNLNTTGSVSAANSVTTISGVQWSLDDDPQGSWTACTASDGAFDETSETYGCDVTGLTDGARVVYTRAYDQNTSYTAASHYASVSFTVDTQGPTSAVEINGGSSLTSIPTVSLTLSSTDITTSVEYMMISNSSDFSDASWEPYVTTKSWTLPEGSGVKTVYAKFKDTVGNVSPVYSDSITLDTTTPDTVWTASTGETRTFSFDSVGDGVVSSVSSDNLYTDDTLPTFSFTRAGDSTSGVNRYQVLLQRQGSEGYSLYIDSIPPDKPGSGSDTSDKTREDDERYIYYGDKDMVKVRSKKESDRLTPGAYKFKVRVYDNAGNYQDSPEKILRVRSHSAVFSTHEGNNTFPLTLLTVGEKSNLNITSLDTTSIPHSLSISSLTPTFYGIANSGATIYLELLKERFDPSINSTRKETFLKKETTVNGESRYGMNLTTEDGLTPGSYLVHLMAQNDQKDYVELPEFILTIGTVQTDSPILGAKDEDEGDTFPQITQTPAVQLTQPSSRIERHPTAPTPTPSPKKCILFDLVCW